MNTMKRPAGGGVAFVAALVVVGGLALAGAAPLYAQGGAEKVAVIDVRRILTESEAGSAALERLRQAAEAKQTALQAQEAEALAIQEDLESRRLSLSAEKVEEIQTDLQRRAIDLRRAQDDARREIEELQVQEFKAIEDKVMPLIQGIGESEGYTLIFNKFEESGLLFAAPGADITGMVLERFNALDEGEG